jgi:hypothetical protein
LALALALVLVLVLVLVLAPRPARGPLDAEPPPSARATPLRSAWSGAAG